MKVPDDRDWDRLSGVDVESLEEEASPGSGAIPFPTLLATGLADLVLLLGLSTTMVLGLSLQSLPFRPVVLYWALAVALLWWLAATVICLKILKADPGMIIAGLVFESELEGSRLVATLLTLLVGSALLGLPLLLGGRGSYLLSRVAGVDLVRRSFA